MERQIVLTTKDKFYTRKEVSREIHAISKMLPYIESFEAFCTNNEVLDVNKGVIVTNYDRLIDMYKYGGNTNTFVYVIGRN